VTDKPLFWEKVTLTLLIAFLFVQVSGQLGIFTCGVNAYIVVSSFDVYTHALGAAVFGAVLLHFISLPGRLDRLWRAWIPFQVAVIGALWELVELIIVWFGLMTPTQMWATIENSVQDIFIDLLGACTISFLYEVIMEK